MDKCFTDYMANQSRRISPAYPTETAAPSRFCVQTELVILLEIRHGHVSSSHYCTSEIPEFGLPKFQNFALDKKLEIPEFGNSGIAIATGALPTPVRTKR